MKTIVRADQKCELGTYCDANTQKPSGYVCSYHCGKTYVAKGAETETTTGRDRCYAPAKQNGSYYVRPLILGDVLEFALTHGFDHDDRFDLSLALRYEPNTEIGKLAHGMGLTSEISEMLSVETVRGGCEGFFVNVYTYVYVNVTSGECTLTN